MGTELRIRRDRGFTDQDLTPILASTHYRGYDTKHKQHHVGVAGHDRQGQEIPDYSLWLEDGDLGIVAYEMAGDSWRELSAFVSELKQGDPSVKITNLEDDDDASEYFD